MKANWFFKVGILSAFGVVVLMSTMFYFFMEGYQSDNSALKFTYLTLLIVIWGVFLKQVYILWKDTYDGIDHMGLNFTLMLGLVFSFAFLPILRFDSNWYFSIGPLIGMFLIWGMFLYFYSNYDDKSRLLKVCVEKTSAKIVDIQYSVIRVNNKPLFNLIIEYSDIKSEIKNLPSNTQAHYHVGDKIKIKYNPRDKKEVILDKDN